MKHRRLIVGTQTITEYTELSDLVSLNQQLQSPPMGVLRVDLVIVKSIAICCHGLCSRDAAVRCDGSGGTLLSLHVVFATAGIFALRVGTTATRVQ